jgi:hypothetical protein
MKFAKMLLAAVAFLAAAGNPAFAQNQQAQPADSQTQEQPEDRSAPADTPAPSRPTHAHSHSTSTSTRPRPPIPEGPRVLVRLEDSLDTKQDKRGKRFVATTLEPITTPEGDVIPQGAQIRGHIDKVQAAGDMGRARLWLTFDEIRTPRGWRPIIAGVIDAPGMHSIRVAYDREGEIEAASVNRDQAMKAAMASAMAGAATGMSTGKEKDAAMAAAQAAATAFMIAYGLGQEFTLERGTKLELVLEKPLHIRRTT